MVLLPLVLAAPALIGPVNLHFGIKTDGNPFDPRENDVRVVFTSGGVTAERLAYYAHGQWHVRAYVPQSGSYSADVRVNGKSVAKLPDITVPKSAPVGMIQTDGKWFKDGDGKPYWPIGINTAWGSSNGRTVVSYFPKMKAAGMNWARVWGCHWDDRNPYWTTNVPKPKDNWMSEEALDRWDDVIQGAEKNDIKFQFVLFHHGMFSSSVNPNWQDHPWNEKNGGFLKSASDFFTDAEAKRRTKMLLRYYVARFGYSTSIMAWELFNEVQFVDRIRVMNDWETVGKWHDEMAEYIRSIDSNQHLITTSSELEKPIWRQTDYKQGHGYPASVAGMLAGTPNTGPKPMFYGEIGPSGAGGGADANEVARREGTWAAFFAGHSGAGEYWTWDLMTDAAFKNYGFATGILKDLPPVRTFVPQAVVTKVDMGGNLTFRPGRGWEKSDLMSFNLPQDAAASKSGMLSSFVQGTGHRDMQPQPIKFVFQSPGAGSMNLHIAEVSGGGGKLEIKVNGTKVAEKAFVGGQRVTGEAANLSVPYAAGRNEIQIENVGSDWVNVDRYSFTGIAPQATVEAVRSDATLVLHTVAAKAGAEVELSNLGLRPGGYTVGMYDLDQRSTYWTFVALRDKPTKLTLNGKDLIIVIKK